MKNQVEALRGYGVKVHVLSSETTFPERQEVSARSLDFVEQKLSSDVTQIEKDLASGHPYARLLYITPESLFSPKFLKSIKIVVAQKELRRLVVDEAHCISVSLGNAQTLAI
jgi:superfamily II DNA helicase RecQ